MRRRAKPWRRCFLGCCCAGGWRPELDLRPGIRGGPIAEDEQLREYIKTLEQRFDGGGVETDMPDPAELVRELEHFLRAERGIDGDG